MLGAAGLDVVNGAGIVVEAGDVGLVGVHQLGVAVGHPLGDEPAHPGALLDPYRRRRPQALHLDGLPQQRHAVGSEREEAVDGVLDLRPLQDRRHQLEGVFELGIEVVGGERELGRRKPGLVEGGDGLGSMEDGAVGVGSHLHGTRRLPLVHEGVHVPHDRVADLVAGLGQDRNRSHVDHLMHGRRERDRGPGHRRDHRRPHPAGHHHVFALDAAAVGHHGPHPAVLDLEIEDLGVGEHRQRLQGLGPLTEDRARPQGIHHRHRGGIEATHDHRLVDERDLLFDLGRGEQLGFDAPGRGRAHPASQLLHPLLGPGHLDAPAGGVDAHLLVLTL